jgi:Uma2 family endonuclease
MSLPQAIDRCTPEEYLRREYGAVERHQYYRGEVFAMSGGSPAHSLIIANVIRELGLRLKGKPCRVYDSNLRVRVPRTTLYTYPDATVACGPLQFDTLDKRQETILNPTLVVEVLSPTTEAWDRGGKFESYRQIESLREYVLVASQQALIETYFRQAGGTWIYAAAGEHNAVVQFNSLGIELPRAEVYDGVDFPARSSDQPAV